MFSKKNLVVLGILLVFGLLSRCELQQEVVISNPEKQIEFSTDTVLFDTIITAIPQITKRLTIRNPNAEAIILRTIALASGENSSYELTINGLKTIKAENIKILGKDSVLVLVRAKIDTKNKDLPYIVRDSVVVDGNPTRHVKLISWGQDANFLNKQVLRRNTVFSGVKPYVIFRSLLVDSLQTLTIEAGTQIYCSFESSIFVKGTLLIKGTPEKPVIIRGIRNDGIYKTALAQWSGIFILEGSQKNIVEYAQIRNGNFGFRVGTPDKDTIPDLTVRNTIIENMAGYGVWAFTSDVVLENTLVNNCILGAAALALGGHYDIKHCTFANFGNNFFREDPVMTCSNFILDNNNRALIAPFFLRLENTIVWGSLPEEIKLARQPQASFEIQHRNNILRTQTTDFQRNNNLFIDPKFRKIDLQNFKPDTLSPARDSGLNLGIKVDLEGKKRDSKPDRGAYEF